MRSPLRMTIWLSAGDFFPAHAASFDKRSFVVYSFRNDVWL
jgi:hypothetical protein